MSWDAYCNLPSAKMAAIIGVDGTQVRVRGGTRYMARVAAAQLVLTSARPDRCPFKVGKKRRLEKRERGEREAEQSEFRLDVRRQ